MLPLFFPLEPESRTFVVHYGLRKKLLDRTDDNDGIPLFDRLVLCMYFILTTFSTVGYGDYYPFSIPEKVAGIFL